MKTIQQIKDKIALDIGCSDWNDLLMTFNKGDHEGFYDQVSIEYANEKLQYAADNIDWSNCYDGGCHCGRDAHEQYIISLKDKEEQ